MTVLVAAISADGTLAPAEAARLNALLSSMRLYRQVAREHVQHLSDTALELTTRAATEELPAACGAVIPEELREKRFVATLQAALAVDDQTAMKILEGLLIKGPRTGGR